MYLLCRPGSPPPPRVTLFQPSPGEVEHILVDRPEVWRSTAYAEYLISSWGRVARKPPALDNLLALKRYHGHARYAGSPRVRLILPRFAAPAQRLLDPAPWRRARVITRSVQEIFDEAFPPTTLPNINTNKRNLTVAEALRSKRVASDAGDTPDQDPHYLRQAHISHLKKLLDAEGINLTRLALETQLSRTHLSRMFKGQSPMTRLHQLAFLQVLTIYRVSNSAPNES